MGYKRVEVTVHSRQGVRGSRREGSEGGDEEGMG
jgi:hypothetical protein